MKIRFGFLAVALTTALLSVSLDSSALTLGNLRGTAVIGRALDVTVQVQPDPTEEVLVNCIAVDVYYAEGRQPAPNIAVATPTRAENQGVTIRIQSPEIVNEPVITVLLRATCGSSNMRRYVLLADLPQAATANVPGTEIVTNTTANPTAAQTDTTAIPTVVVLPEREAPVAKTSRVKSKTPKADAKTTKTVKPKKTALAASDTTDFVVRKAADRPTGKSMLKLDPMEMLSDRIDSLDSLMLFAPTEDALLQIRQISTLQADMKTMRELAAKNDAKLLELRTQLQQAQDEQISIYLIYGLIALLLTSLGGLAWVWHRQRRAKGLDDTWWHDPDEDSPATVLMQRPSQVQQPDQPGAPMGLSAATVAPLPVEPVAVAPAVQAPKVAPVKPQEPAKVVATGPDLTKAQAPAHMSEVDLNIDLDHFMLKESDQAKPKASQINKKVGNRVIPHLNSEPILDIRQQAEFFVSLGQTDRALRILKKQIAESTEPNPFVYLDLIGLYHSLGLKVDFREQREAFNNQFNGKMPDFQDFNQEGKDLQAYPDVISDLTQLWPSAQALVFLDANIFYDPQAQTPPSFDLAAFRDLLMLHALAEEVAVDLPPVAPAKAGVALKTTAPTASAAVSLPASERAAPALPDPTEPSPALPSLEPQFEITLAPTDTQLKPATLPISYPSLPEQSPSEPEQSVVESPSRMLDLDFSTLGATDKPAPETAPLITPPVRYATRSRWPVNKKPKP